MSMIEFIEALTKQIEEIETKYRNAWWKVATSGEEGAEKELKDAQIALRSLFASKEGFDILSKSTLDAPLLERQRIVLLNEFHENQISKELIAQIVEKEVEIESIYTNFRPVVDGKPISNNELKKNLSSSLSVALRQKSWEASKEMGGQVSQKVLDLIALRNKAAIEAKFSNFYSMRLKLQEIDEERLFALLEELDKLTTPLWKQYKKTLDEALAKKFQIDAAALRPWHYSDPFFQEAPQEAIDLDPFYKDKDIAKISQEFFKAEGFDVEDILKRSDLYEREKKSQHAFCSCLNRKEDVRILCNLKDNEYWMGTQLHELGHAVYDKYIDPSLPYILRCPAHTCTTEAIAMLFGRLSKSPEFLKTYCAVKPEAIDPVAALCHKQNAANLLVFVRWGLVMVHFERAMYQQKDVKLNTLWWDLVEKYQEVKRPEKRDLPDWAAKLHLACAPAYYQNYILGEMTASQIKAGIEETLAPKKEPFISSKEVGTYLIKNLFALGASYPWDETILWATGKPLDPKYFAKDLSILG